MKRILPLFLLGASGLAAPTLGGHVEAHDYDLHDGPRHGPPCIVCGVPFENAHETRLQLRDAYSRCKPSPDQILLDKLLTICIEDNEGKQYSHRDRGRYDHSGIDSLVANIVKPGANDVEILKRDTVEIVGSNHRERNKIDLKPGNGEEVVVLDVLDRGRENGNPGSNVNVGILDRQRGRDGKPWDIDEDHWHDKGDKYWDKDTDHRGYEKNRYLSKYGKDDKHWEKETGYWDHSKDHSEDHDTSKYDKDEKYYLSKHGKEDKYWEKETDHWDRDKDHHTSKDGKYWDKGTSRWIYEKDGKCWKWENGQWILIDIVENDGGRGPLGKGDREILGGNLIDV